VGYFIEWLCIVHILYCYNSAFWLQYHGELWFDLVWVTSLYGRWMLSLFLRIADSRAVCAHRCASGAQHSSDRPPRTDNLLPLLWNHWENGSLFPTVPFVLLSFSFPFSPFPFSFFPFSYPLNLASLKKYQKSFGDRQMIFGIRIEAEVLHFVCHYRSV